MTRKKIHGLLATIMAVLLLCTSAIPVYAAPANSHSLEYTSSSEGISPRLTNCATATFTFSIVDGEAVFVVSYAGREETFTTARLEVQIQKKFLGLFWINVGDPWTGSCDDLDGRFYGTVPVDGSGTYRANFVLRVTGNTGVVDEIEDSIERTA